MLRTTRIPRKRKRQIKNKPKSGIHCTLSSLTELGSLDSSDSSPLLIKSRSECYRFTPPSESSCDTPPHLIESRSESSCDTPPLMESRSESSCDTPPPLTELRSETYSNTSTPLVKLRSETSSVTPLPLMELRTEISCHTPSPLIELRSESSSETPLLLSKNQQNSIKPQQNLKKFSECSPSQQFYRLKKVWLYFQNYLTIYFDKEYSRIICLIVWICYQMFF